MPPDRNRWSVRWPPLDGAGSDQKTDVCSLKVSYIVECLYAEVKELLSLPGICEFEINGCVAIFPVAHIGGEDWQGDLRVLSPGTDAI